MVSKKFNLFAVLLVVIIFSIFFYRLFVPELKIYATSDFGRSEIWSLNYPLKDFLSRTLKQGRLPFWSKDVGGGYPVFAEGQIGSLYIPNMILFGLLPTPLAWNISYVLIFLTTFLSCYLLFFKNLKNSYASLFGATVFTFNGFMISHIPHFALVQSAALLPLVLLSSQILSEKPDKVKIFIFAYILSQQIFIGHPQVSFMTLLSVGILYLARNNFYMNKLFIRKAYILLFSIVLGILFSAPQLLPGIELYGQSIRSSGNTLTELSRFPYFLKYLLTTIFPYVFGNPSRGTFPDFSEGKGIFWEINSFVGILPLVLAFAAFYKRKDNWWLRFLGVLLFISLILSLSYKVPFSFVYLLPGFNLFRVSSRFLLLFTFSLSGLSAAGYVFITEKIKLNKSYFSHVLFLMIIIPTAFALFGFGMSYNPVVSFKKFLAKPELTNIIPDGKKTYTDSSQYNSWNKLLKKQVVGENPETFLYLRNGLDPYLNLIFNKNSTLSEISAPLKRQSVIYKYPHIDLLSSAASEYSISTQKFGEGGSFELVHVLNAPGQNLPNYYIYKNKQFLQRFRLVSDYEIRKFDYKNPEWNFKNDKNTFENAVLLEEPLREIFEKNGTNNIELIIDTDDKLVVETKTEVRSILVIADTLYPGWQAKVNGVRTKILNANISQRAVIVPEGENLIEMEYIPWSFYFGSLISLGALIVFVKYKLL